jgi:hypothetical protein
VYRKTVLFFGVGVLFWLVFGGFLPFLWGVLWVLWVGAVGRCCCLALFCGAYPLPVTRTPYPYFLTLNYPF